MTFAIPRASSSGSSIHSAVAKLGLAMDECIIGLEDVYTLLSAVSISSHSFEEVS
ncbi:hypothetical protein MY494_03115 [Synechococcus sp. A10-1-5-1]|uniref:hypothetical protein n=1 Tax=Synechococcus sp. A10-1-5-1 TaxID=2936507 RepID=UPI002001C310|nr:hypothetical protein [Synechococcus sp. A10-1-5-1]UPM50790.1 hypothetical protein MY494_03115 [Synechococcus sp. A10-1-5-1]